MLHTIPTEKLGPLGEPMAQAVSACVHCGFCLAACPTYRELGQEMDTPRGRIVLMKEVLEGTLRFGGRAAARGPLPRLPRLRAGLPERRAYRDLISPFRALAAGKVQRARSANGCAACSPRRRCRIPRASALAAWLGTHRQSFRVR